MSIHSEQRDCELRSTSTLSHTREKRQKYGSWRRSTHKSKRMPLKMKCGKQSGVHILTIIEHWQKDTNLPKSRHPKRSSENGGKQRTNTTMTFWKWLNRMNCITPHTIHIIKKKCVTVRNTKEIFLLIWVKFFPILKTKNSLNATSGWTPLALLLMEPFRLYWSLHLTWSWDFYLLKRQTYMILGYITR